MNLTMTPGQPQKNPVFLINGWNSPTVQVKVNGQALPKSGLCIKLRAMT